MLTSVVTLARATGWIVLDETPLGAVGSLESRRRGAKEVEQSTVGGSGKELVLHLCDWDGNQHIIECTAGEDSC